MNINNEKVGFEEDYFVGKTSGYTTGYGKATELIKERLKLVLKYVETGKLIEATCAYGFFLEDAKQNFECYGFDISKFAIEKSKKIPDINTKVNSVTENWGYEDNLADVIVMWDLIEHIKDDDKAIKEAVRYLKPNKFLFIQTPNKFIRNLVGDKDITHINKHNMGYWKKLFISNNLKIVDSYYEFPRFVGHKDWINNILRKLRLPLGTNICFVLKNMKNE